MGLAGRIFICYRRIDTPHAAERLHSTLATHFGIRNVFMDVDSIDPSQIAEVIDDAVGACDVLLALIGPHWSDAVAEDGLRRLDDPYDLVTLEITAALRRRIHVIPVLVDGAPPLWRGDLPEALATLARRKAIRLEHASFGTDVAALMIAIERALKAPTADVEDQPKSKAAVSASGDREKWHSLLDVQEHDRFETAWTNVQRGFVYDDPQHIVRQADALVIEIMRARGYPVDDFDRHAEDIAIEHPQLVQHYYDARATRVAIDGGAVESAWLRQAVMSYRALIDELLHRDSTTGSTAPESAPKTDTGSHSQTDDVAAGEAADKERHARSTLGNQPDSVAQGMTGRLVGSLEDESRFQNPVKAFNEGVASLDVGTPSRDEPRKIDAVPTDALVFLCHSSSDKEHVRDLYRKLSRDSIRCWFDEEDLLPGQNWQYEISRAIKRSRFVLACLSKASVTKTGYIQKELKKALDLADEQPEGIAYLIPIRLEECDIPDRLGDFQWVDLFKDDGYRRLLLGLRAGLAQDTLRRSEPG